MSEVEIREERGIGRITLNRPRALNALTLGMIEAIDAALARWESEAAIAAVLVDGAGERGLCAGGDIRAIYDALPLQDSALPARFFKAEYRMNARIAAFPKPYIAIMDGITMGGGIGISAHGSIRIVTERSRLAMPETGIGFIPDVGGSYLLAHAPDELGMHAALTAQSFGAADACRLGLADICVPASSLPALVTTLLDSPAGADLRERVAAFVTAPPPGTLELDARWIARCYAQETVEAIHDALLASEEAGARAAAESMAGKSPTSLKATFRALREARGDTQLAQALEREFRLAMACLEKPDFREGVRAALVDKDRNPRWSPASLDEVTEESIEAMFRPSRHGTLGLAA